MWGGIEEMVGEMEGMEGLEDVGGVMVRVREEVEVVGMVIEGKGE